MILFYYMRIVLYTFESASIHFLFDPQTLHVYYIAPAARAPLQVVHHIFNGSLLPTKLNANYGVNVKVIYNTFTLPFDINLN